MNANVFIFLKLIFQTLIKCLKHFTYTMAQVAQSKVVIVNTIVLVFILTLKSNLKNFETEVLKCFRQIFALESYHNVSETVEAYLGFCGGVGPKRGLNCNFDICR